MPDEHAANQDALDHSAASSHGGAGGQGHGGGNHGGGGHEEHEGAPEWLISFADNVMLQMGFFVILLGMAMQTPAGRASGDGKEGPKTGGPTAEQLDFAIAVRDAFNNPVDLDSSDPRDLPLIQRMRARGHGDDGDQSGSPSPPQQDQGARDMLVPSGIAASVSFETRSHTLSKDAQASIDQIAERFRGCHTRLELRGHCSAAEAYGIEDRGMQLSSERAFTVAQALVAKGVSWAQLRLSACADTDRAASTAYRDAEHRSNQRVEVIELAEAAEP